MRVAVLLTALLLTAPRASTLPPATVESPALPPVVTDPLEPFGPTAIDPIAAELARFQMRLAPDEVRAAAAAVVEESERWGLDREVVMSVIRIESAFNSFARSHVGALGLMQVMPATGEDVARDLGIEWRGAEETLFDPVTNVRIGTAYLAWLHGRYDDLDRALAAYNWGPHVIDYRIRTGRALPKQYVAKFYEALQSRSER